MSVKALIDQASKLSRFEQAELLDALLWMVGPEEKEVALTPAQQRDLDRRIEEYRSGSAQLIAGDDAEAMLRARR